jgi:hypothetical protein
MCCHWTKFVCWSQIEPNSWSLHLWHKVVQNIVCRCACNTVLLLCHSLVYHISTTWLLIHYSNMVKSEQGEWNGQPHRESHLDEIHSRIWNVWMMVISQEEFGSFGWAHRTVTRISAGEFALYIDFKAQKLRASLPPSRNRNVPTGPSATRT